MNLNASDINGATEKVQFVISSFAAPAIKDAQDGRLVAWQASVKQIHTLLADTAKTQIAMVGTTGAGKSTLLNAVLEHELLPTGVMEPCTSFVTSVSTSGSSDWRLEISYLSTKEWETELEILQDAIHGSEGEDAESDEDRAESNKLARMARAKLAAVFGLKKEAINETFDVRKQPVPSQVDRALSRLEPEQVTFPTFAELHGHLKGLVRGDSLVWPLIERVKASGPIPQLPEGVELVDLPGLNDPNRVRVETTRKFLTTAPHIWVVFNMKRGLTDDIHGILRERGLLRRLILGGNYRALALVGTHADDVDADNAESLGLDADSDFCQIYAEYRRQVRSKAREQVADLVADMRQPNDNEATLHRLVEVARAFPVIPTSARAFLRLKGITRAKKDYGIGDPVDTGIPEVQKHLAKVAADSGPATRLREARDRLGMLCDELEFFFRSPGSGVSSAQRQQARVELDRALEAFSVEVKAIHSQAQSQYAGYREAFLRSLRLLVPEAKKGVERSTDHWSGIHHKTLQAILKRGGCFVSPSTGREYDFNDDVSSPLLNLLPVKWEHFFQDQIDRVVGDATTKIEAHANAMAAQIAFVLRIGTGGDGVPGTGDHLQWFNAKMEFLRDKCRELLAQQIRERRGKLSGDVYNTAKGQMQPAYHEAQNEEGRGMKARMLLRVQSHASQISSPLHETIESDLTAGLGEVWLQLEINLQRLFDEVRTKAEQIVSNATADLIDPTMTKTVTQSLATLTEIRHAVGAARD
jgi:hypothetical protein